MIDHYAYHLALRARALTLSVCSTGAVTLSATATGYARGSGSFLTDGFAPGMELFGSGFSNAANNAAKVITAVTALSLTCAGCVAEGGGSRTLSVGLPSRRAWGNVELEDTQGPYVEEDYVPAASRLLGLVRLGSVELTGLYVLRLFGVQGVGLGALSSMADALLALFPAGLALSVPDADLRVRGDVAPFRGQILNTESGHAVLSVTIPWRVLTLNPN